MLLASTKKKHLSDTSKREIFSDLIILKYDCEEEENWERTLMRLSA